VNAASLSGRAGATASAQATQISRLGAAKQVALRLFRRTPIRYLTNEYRLNKPFLTHEHHDPTGYGRRATPQ
jgi:hypothetical protein